MSELSTRIRKLVNDPTVSEVYGAWGMLQPIQRKQIREVCDTCDNFESTADDLYYTLLGVMHSVDKWLDGDELKQHEVNRAATMREKTLQIIEGQTREIISLQRAVNNSLPSGVQACSEEEAMKIGYERGRAAATKELLDEINRRLPTDKQFNNCDIQLGYAWAMTAVQRLLSDIRAERLSVDSK